MNIRLMIFDFDGTLGDTRRNVVVTMQQTLEALHLPERSEEACAATIGIPLEGCFRQLLPDVPEEVILQCAATYRRIFEVNKEKMRPQPFPHVAETLKTLHEQGIKMTVATSRGLESVKDLLTGMGLIHYFDYLLGADSVTKHKPDPEPVLQTLRELHEEADHTLVVGDMPVDILMGSRAGCKTCGVTYGNASREELLKAGADSVIDDFSELTISHF